MSKQIHCQQRPKPEKGANVRLHEYEGADAFESKGIPVPRRGVAETVEDALGIAEEIGYPVILKAQVLVGGRGLAGGIKTASSPEELQKLSETLFRTKIKDLPVRKIMISEMADIDRELYAGVTIDGFSGKPVIVISTEGGVNIEETARTSPEKIASVHVDNQHGFYPYQARAVFRKLGLPQRLIPPCVDAVIKLYDVFKSHEALIAEINPLAILKNGSVLALDAVLEIDDSALYRVKEILPRHQEETENPLEQKGREIGVTYVDLDGDIGLISSGAGLGMASMDIIGQKLRPGNFLETGGGITEELLYKCMELVMMKKGLRGLFINIYGGIKPIQGGARGIARYIKEKSVTIPVVAKALGNHQEETWEILKSGGVHVVTGAATETAIDKLVELVEK